MLDFKMPPDRLPFEMPGRSPGCLLLHGFTGDPREMRTLADGISGRLGLYVHVPLQPGHGGPPHLMEGLTADDFMDSAREALARVREQHERVIIIGFSMGGALAAELIAEQPADALVAIAPMLTIRSPLLPLAAVARRVMPWVYPLKLASIDALGIREQLLEYDPTLDLDDPATLTMLREEIRFPMAIIDELRQMTFRAREAAPGIHAPTLVIQGDADLTLDPAGAQWLYENVAARDKQLRMFPRAGHDIIKAHSPHNRKMVASVVEWIAERFGCRAIT